MRPHLLLNYPKFQIKKNPIMKKAFPALALSLGIALSATAADAALRIDVKNDSSEDCSLAVNSRTDKTKWVTGGWYVFASGEEAPILLDDVSDLHNVYIYSDCQKGVPQNAETKKVWVRTNLKFYDEVPRDNEKGYEEVVFVRLESDKYVITD